VKQRRALFDVAPDGDAAVYLRRIARKLAEGTPLPALGGAR
jgi:hypothetical protein